MLWSPVLICMEEGGAAMMQLGRLHWCEGGDGGWMRQRLGQHLKQAALYAGVDSGGCRLRPASARRH